jgi:glycerol uptake facilitator protein
VGNGMAEVTTGQKLAAEFLGTAALVIGGPGTATATFQAIGVGNGKPGSAPFSMAELGVISFAFMLVILAIIYTIGHISGCHINPAVTVALAAAKKFAWADVPGYLAAQFAGGIVGAIAIWSFLGKIGSAYLSYKPGNTGHAFMGELIGTFLLVLVVFGTATDSRATPGWYGLAIPSIVFAVITAEAPVTGAALNPARYLGPMVGRVFTGEKDGLLWNQLPIYFLATFVGALIAAGVYGYLGSTKASASVPEQQPVAV